MLKPQRTFATLLENPLVKCRILLSHVDWSYSFLVVYSVGGHYE